MSILDQGRGQTGDLPYISDESRRLSDIESRLIDIEDILQEVFNAVDHQTKEKHSRGAQLNKMLVDAMGSNKDVGWVEDKIKEILDK